MSRPNAKSTYSNDQMPEFLSKYLLDLSEATWRSQSLRLAREQVEESVATSKEMSTPDTLFEGRMLLARIDAAVDRHDVAVQLKTRMRRKRSDRGKADPWC